MAFLRLKTELREENPDSFAKNKKVDISMVMVGLFLPSGQQLAATISSTRS